jgi:aminopeptidase N
MKSLRNLLILPLFMAIAACRPVQTIEQDQVPTDPGLDPFEIPWSDLTYQSKAWRLGSYDPVVDLSSATEYRMEITIPGDFKSLHGRQRIRYTNNESVSLNEIYLRLFPNISGGDARLASVTVNGLAVDVVYEAEDSTARIPLEESLAPGGSIELALEFSVSIPREMGGNYGLFGYFDGFLVLDTFYPMIPAYDESGWQREPTPPYGDPTYNDVSFYLVQVRAPADLVLVTTGSEVDLREEDGDQLVTFASGPARDFYLAAAAELEVFETQVGSTIVRSYAPARFQDHAELVLNVGARALEAFQARFGDYPYPEMELISTPMQALGIEYPGVMGIALNLYDPEATIGGVPTNIYLESTVAHEVAHQWFYNVVGNDQVREPWLDEALAQYSTYLYYLDSYGEMAASDYSTSWFSRWDQTDRADIPIGLPVDQYQGAEYGSIVYGRGPIFIDELSTSIGQERLDEFLQEYVQQNAWGIVSTESFQALAEDTCDCDLDALFERWVIGAD